MKQYENEELAQRYWEKISRGERGGGKLDFSDPEAVAFLLMRLGGADTLARHAPGVAKLMKDTIAMDPADRVPRGEHAPAADGNGRRTDPFTSNVSIRSVSCKPAVSALSGSGNAKTAFTTTEIFNLIGGASGLLGGCFYDASSTFRTPLGSFFQEVKEVETATLTSAGELSVGPDGRRTLFLECAFSRKAENAAGVPFMEVSLPVVFMTLLNGADIITGFKPLAPVSNAYHTAEKEVLIYYYRGGGEYAYDYRYDKQNIQNDTKDIDIWAPLEIEFGVPSGYEIEELDFEASWQLFLYETHDPETGDLKGVIPYYGALAKKKITTTTENGKIIKLRCALDPEWNDTITNIANHMTDQHIHFDVCAIIRQGSSTGRATLILDSGEVMEESSTAKRLKPLHIVWGCLAKGTLVRMADGHEKRIEDIRPGDAVLDASGNSVPVVDVTFGAEREVVRIATESGRSIDASFDHPFHTGRGVRRARDFRPGLPVLVMGADGRQATEKVASVETVPYSDTVYNLRFDEERALVCNGFVTGDHEAQQHAGLSATNTRDVRIPGVAAPADPLQAEWKRLAAVLASPLGLGDGERAANGEEEPENLDLHYFTVKMLAMEAGFSEPDAQRIAEFSQYTGDNNAGDAIEVDAWPKEAELQNLILDEHGKTTARYQASGLGREQWRDAGALRDPETQRRVIVPFHYFPPEKLDFAAGASYRAAPDSPVLAEYLDLVAANYLNSSVGAECMRLGVLAHVIADCHIHRMFSGLESDGNTAELTRAVRHTTGEDVLADFDPESARALPPVGAAQTGGAPDAAGLDFRIDMNGGEEQIVNESSSVERFLSASRAVHAFLSKCLGKTPLSPETFDRLYRERLARVHSLYRPGAKERHAFWTDEYPDGAFRYNRASIFQTLRQGTKTANNDAERYDDFFRFALILDDIANLAADRPLVFTADPEFTGEDCRIALRVEKDDPRAYQFRYTFYRDNTPIGGNLVEIGTGKQSYGYELTRETQALLKNGTTLFLETEYAIGKETFRKGKTCRFPKTPRPIVVPWLASPLGTNPVRKEITQVSNGVENPLADYCFPDNRDGLFLPVTVKMQVADCYEVDDSFTADLRLASTRSNETHRHKGTSKLTRVGDYLVAEFGADWKTPRPAGSLPWHPAGELKLVFRHKRLNYSTVETISFGPLCERDILFDWPEER